MLHVALKMLVGDRGKYLGVLLGLILTSFFLTQQPAMFLGIVKRVYALVTQVGPDTLWVMDSRVPGVNDVIPLPDTMLGRVRGVSGVEWAVPFYDGSATVQLPDGAEQKAVLIGLDDATLIGGPAVMVAGTLSGLRETDGIVINESGAANQLATPNPILGRPRIPLKLGDVVEMNDKRAVVVGLSAGGLNSSGLPTIYTTYSRAKTYAPSTRNMLSFILAKVKPGIDAKTVIHNIRRWTGLAAYTATGFERKTEAYALNNTPALTVFGLSAAIGFAIGGLIAGQIFYNFTLENLRYFGVIRAMGATNRVLLQMIMAQALTAGAIGYGIGIGAVCLLGLAIGSGGRFSLEITWLLLLTSAVAVLVLCLAAAAISVRKVIRFEPAAVFRV